MNPTGPGHMGSHMPEPELWMIGNARMAFTDRHLPARFGPQEARRLGADAARGTTRASRAKVAAAFGLTSDRVVYMNEVHGADVRHVTAQLPDDPPMDALCTTEVALALAVPAADCAPVLLADAVAGVIGAAHSGRRGTALGVVGRLLETMVSHGAEPSRVTGLIGPLVCGLCYEVPTRMRAEMVAVAPDAWATTRSGTSSIDLRRAVEAQLRTAGVRDIRHDRRCTVESPELFSYRREGPTGNFAGYVWLEPPVPEQTPKEPFL
jgi:purine-nucleoside/S-methyl-5'-thioadenosine phosphorylase / adenosine deaminase